MPLIKNGKIEHDAWHYHKDGSELCAGQNIISLACWQQHKATLLSSATTLGLLVQGDESPKNFSDDLPHFSLLAIEIPVFADGRGYSLAKTLRQHYGFTEEIRAVGDILPDQAQYLSRVGFDAFEIANERLTNLAIEKLTEISAFYQPI
jgi:uncharacterized protein (DUF934 family)